VKASDLALFAGTALSGHRVRTALSLSGVAVGIAAVIALTALGQGAREYVVREFTAMGSHVLIVFPGKVETTGGGPIGGAPRDLTLEDFRAVVSRTPGIVAAAPLASGEETLRYGARNRAALILGTTAEFRQVRRVKMGAGSFLPRRDARQAGSEIVLGAKLARELFGPESPLGKVVRMGTWRFRVVGVMAPRGRAMGIDVDDVALAPIQTVMAAFNRTSLFRVFIEVRDKRLLPEVKERVTEMFRERHRAEDVTVITQDAMLSAFSDILNALTLALAGIASISLAVAGVGIMNVMLISVTERRSEIGLLKALGGTDRQVLLVFLAESGLLALMGGLAGLAVGLAAVALFTGLYPSFPASAPLWAVAASILLSLSVGIGFGLWPAWRATKLDPVRALTGR
jgi:putative ABC transport system permease protein